MTNTSLRALPSVDRLVNMAQQEINDVLTRDEIVRIARAVLQDVRQADTAAATPTHEELAAMVIAEAHSFLTPSLQPVINASGVIVQTNLGRAPLSQAAIAAMQ